MGIFNSLPAAVGEKADKTVIAKGTRFTGVIHSDALLMIDGHVEGEVISTSDVSVGVNGHFIGQMKAKRILVSGQAEGELESERLEVMKSGLVNGNLLVQELTIEPGGRFFGQSREANKPAGEKAAAQPKKKAASEPEAPVLPPMRTLKEA